MDLNLKEALLQAVEAAAWSERDKILARAIAADYTLLVTQELLGMDVTDEMKMVKASLANIGVATGLTGQYVFLDVLGKIVKSLMVLMAG